MMAGKAGVAISGLENPLEDGGCCLSNQPTDVTRSCKNCQNGFDNYFVVTPPGCPWGYTGRCKRAQSTNGQANTVWCEWTGLGC